MLLEARDEETGEAMSDKLLRDELITMVLAGHETTANALSLALYLALEAPGGGCARCATKRSGARRSRCPRSTT